MPRLGRSSSKTTLTGLPSIELWNTDWWWGRIKADDMAYFADDGVTFADGIASLNISNTASSGLPYTSSVITTYQKFSFRFGRVELRAKTPRLGNLVCDLLAASTAWPPEIGVVGSDVAHFDRVSFWTTGAPAADATTTTDAAPGQESDSADVGQQGSYFSGPTSGPTFTSFKPIGVPASSSGASTGSNTSRHVGCARGGHVRHARGGNGPGERAQYATTGAERSRRSTTSEFTSKSNVMTALPGADRCGPEPLQATSDTVGFE